MPTETPAAFFSYSREDSDFALRLAGDLKAAGANVWLDQLDIEPGMPWDREVENALTKCPRMIVILSPVSVKSDNVRDEISFALSKQKRVLPVLYRDCDVPFRLARLNHIDFRTDYARGLELLLRALPRESQPPISDVIELQPTAEQERLERERKDAAEQAWLEHERKQAADQARLEEESKQAVAEKARLEQQEPERQATAEKARLGRVNTI